tara:strand:- start:41 stop:370 length:330 start_codon:yes stop_codon:yes gene_type:complete
MEERAEALRKSIARLKDKKRILKDKLKHTQTKVVPGIKKDIADVKTRITYESRRLERTEQTIQDLKREVQRAAEDYKNDAASIQALRTSQKVSWPGVVTQHYVTQLRHP